MAKPEYSVHVGDALEVGSDILLLTYAQSRFGVDENVSNVLVDHGLCSWDEIEPAEGRKKLRRNHGIANNATLRTFDVSRNNL